MEKLMRTGRVATAVVLLLAILVANLIFFFVVPVRAAPLDTYHSDWKLIRETADEDGATFAAVYDLTTQGNFANKDTTSWLTANGGAYNMRSYAGSGIGTEFQSSGSVWMFVICGKNYDVGADNTIDNTFSYNIIGWSKINGMLQVIAEGAGILGTQAVIEYPIDSSSDLGTNAVGALIDMTGVAYTNNNTTFSKTGVGIGVVTGMMIYVTSSNESNLANGYYAVTGRTDDTIVCSGTGGSGDATATVQSNPAFWADTITLDETTKWTSAANEGTIAIINSADNEVAAIVVKTTGLEWIQFVIYDALPAQTGEAGDITVYGRLCD